MHKLCIIIIIIIIIISVVVVVVVVVVVGGGGGVKAAVKLYSYCGCEMADRGVGFLVPVL
jgi:hypothetical protein